MAIISIPTSLGGVSIPGQLGDVLSGPLKSLYAGTGLKDTYNYPSDLGTDPTKLHYVQFQVREIIPAGYTSLNGSPKGAKPSIQVGTLSSAFNSGLSAISEGASAFESFLNDIPGVDISNGEIGSSFKTVTGTLKSVVSNGIAISPTLSNIRSVVSLYMPDTLTATYDASYEELSLTDLGAGINTLRAINEIATSAKGKLTGGGAMGALNAVGSDPASIQLAMQALGQTGLGGKLQIDPSVLGEVLLKGQGYSINPQLQMIYRGIDMRKFQLSFFFTPKSKDESSNVEKIINMFKFHFAPTIQSGASSSATSMFLIPPSIFNVNFKINGKENKYLPKYGDCVLTNIDVNYAPNGWASHDDGFPVQTQLTLEFMETEILHKDKLLKGFANADGGLR